MRVWCVRAWGVGLGLFAVSSALAQPEAGQAPRTITSVMDFWTTPLHERAEGVPYHFEFDVLYYDPEWQILHVHDGEVGEYVATEDVLPIRSGQRISLRGRTRSPPDQFIVTGAEVRVLGAARVVAEPINLARIDHARTVNAWVQLEGLVDRQGFDGPGHLRLDLVADGLPVIVWVMVDPAAAVPQWAGRFVRVRGVYGAKFNPSGGLAAVEVFSPGIEAVDPLALLGEAPQFAPARRAIEDLPAVPAGERVTVRGQVVAVESGRRLEVRDATGQVAVEVAQVATLPAGGWVEAVGVATQAGVDLRLQQAWVRAVPDADAAVAAVPPAGLPLLHRVAATVLELSPTEVAREDPVQLNGVVTWSSVNAMSFFMQDASGAVRVRRPDAARPPPEPGRHVAVFGRAGQGEFAPVVQADRVTEIGSLTLPEAREITLEQALTGLEEGRWVQLTGFVHRVRRDGAGVRLEVSTPSGALVARLPDDDTVAGLVGSVVALKGVCVAMVDTPGKLTGVELWVPGLTAVRVVEAMPEDVFALPRLDTETIGRFNTAANLHRRLKVEGTVLHAAPDGRIFLEDADTAVQVRTRSAILPGRGDRVEVAGFLGREGGRVLLREALWRRVGRADLPVAHVLGEPGRVQPELDGRRVAVEGRVLEQFGALDEVRIALQAGRAVFEVRWQGGGGAGAVLPGAGSLLRADGVYAVDFNDQQEPLGFHLLVRDAGQLVVLDGPAWWTARRVVAAAVVLVGLVVVMWWWARRLQRRVRWQTTQLEEQLRRTSQLELDLARAGRLESLGTLAGGIAHDFNNLLTVMLGNVSLVEVEEVLSPEGKSRMVEARQAVLRARDLAQKLITFAKGGAPVMGPVEMGAVLRDGVADLELPEEVTVRWALDDTCLPALGDRRQLVQVVGNVLRNARQAMPRGGTLGVTLALEDVVAESDALLRPGSYVRLEVRDSGEGIAAANLARVFDPYFTTRPGAHGLGLAVAYSIVRRHRGRVAIESTPMVGTTVRVWLPAAMPPGAAPVV